jgi:DNA repair protein RadC
MVTNIQIREVQVSYQPLQGELFKVRSSKDAFDYLVKMYNEATIGLYEEFMVLLLNRANGVLGSLKLSWGGQTGIGLLFASVLTLTSLLYFVSSNIHPFEEHPL